MQITCFQHTVTQNIHSHSKMDGREHHEEILDQSKTKKQTLPLHVWCSARSSDFQPFLLCWFHTLLAAVFQKCLMTLTSLGVTSRGVQHNPGFTFTASCNGLLGPLSRDSSLSRCHTLPTISSFLNSWEKSLGSPQTCIYYAITRDSLLSSASSLGGAWPPRT